jgi:transcriptional regulator with XRE-family HTH domain
MRLREAVGKEIKVLLIRHDMSAVALAARIGRSQSYLSRRLTGEVALDLDDLEAISDVFGVPPVALVPADS